MARSRAHRRIVIVPYAEDLVRVSKADAQETLLAPHAWLASFGLMLREDKTELIDFDGSWPSRVSGAANGGPRPSP
ncbi:hypothetical protein [Bradyrhizobium sp. SSUT77]|uniref:hypothetical protein n=1 Tax=Bradyrhizobium sp. SSUT77 TaxID=3040603 RepID=UPI002446B635|nr:hypothetical protein [Bradyrhizobium sp. SSUT77]MDH2348176.1 hypothetical protein [Bradyrhizobium sp. SSUT77]